MKRLHWAGPKRFGGAEVIVGYRVSVTGIGARNSVAIRGEATPLTVVIAVGESVCAWNVDGTRCSLAALRAAQPDLDALLNRGTENN